MSTRRRILISAAASALTVAVVFAVLAFHPLPVLSPGFVAVGFQLAYPILQILPESVVRALAPEGGPEAVAWAVAIGTCLAWFAVFFAFWFAVLRSRIR